MSAHNWIVTMFRRWLNVNIQFHAITFAVRLTHYSNTVYHSIHKNDFNERTTKKKQKSEEKLPTNQFNKERVTIFLFRLCLIECFHMHRVMSSGVEIRLDICDKADVSWNRFELDFQSDLGQRLPKHIPIKSHIKCVNCSCFNQCVNFLLLFRFRCAFI